jgi:tripartite-type tricarboxylate transporter receptor subunit TctC
MHRRKLGRLGVLAAVGAAATVGGAAYGQNFPIRPVRLVVPSPAGGPTDAIARLIAPALAGGWEFPAVVDNRVGGTGVVGSQAVARSAPDGHTLLVNASMHAIIPSVMPSLPFHVVDDFTAVALLATGPYVLVAHPSFPAASLPDLIALAKARPGRVHYASPGNGTGNHLASELLKVQAGIDLVHVPYAGAAPATTDVVAGTVPLLLNNMISAVPHIAAGRLRALAVTSLRRSPALPDVPTFAETLPGFEAITWYGMFGPAGMPATLVAELNRRANAAGQSEAVRTRLAALGVEPAAEMPERFHRFVEAEVAKWAEVARLSGARLD